MGEKPGDDGTHESAGRCDGAAHSMDGGEMPGAEVVGANRLLKGSKATVSQGIDHHEGCEHERMESPAHDKHRDAERNQKPHDESPLVQQVSQPGHPKT